MFFLTCIGVGAILGGTCGHLAIAGRTQRSLEDVHSVSIDETDPAERRARSRTVGRIEGLHLSAVIMLAFVGGAAGLAVWLLTFAFDFFF
jgi:hypothetical protein